MQYTFKADVWAYGIVLWELATRGLIPYADLEFTDILRLLKSGHRLTKPKGCPDNLYLFQLLFSFCWLDPFCFNSFYNNALQTAATFKKTSISVAVASVKFQYYSVFSCVEKDSLRVTEIQKLILTFFIRFLKQINFNNFASIRKKNVLF